MQEKSFFIDTTLCTACRGCQIACKQWHKLPAEKTRNRGSHQNPPDLNFNTYKLIRFNEVTKNGKIQDWLFFQDQCRHCLQPPCKMTADMYVEDAIIKDPHTGAVIFTEKTRELDFEEVRASCPYDIPRLNKQSNVMSKCDMCLDRVHNGLLPACVSACPTGAMNFGDREDMLELAEERLEKVKKIYPQAVLGDKNSVRAIFLFAKPPKDYYSYAVASLSTPRLWTRKEFLAGLRKRPVKRVLG